MFSQSMNIAVSSVIDFLGFLKEGRGSPQASRIRYTLCRLRVGLAVWATSLASRLYP